MLVDFAGATVAPSKDSSQTDRVQLLVTTATAAGTERAVAAAVESLGTDGVEALLPYLQSAALRTPLRKAVKAAGDRHGRPAREVASAVDAEVPDLVKLRRAHLVDGDPGLAARARRGGGLLRREQRRLGAVRSDQQDQPSQ